MVEIIGEESKLQRNANVDYELAELDDIHLTEWEDEQEYNEPTVEEIVEVMISKANVKSERKGENLTGLYCKKEENESQDMLLPFKSVKINGVIEGPIATLDIDLTYINPHEDNPIECNYEFPLDKDTIFAKLVCKIENRQVEAEVKSKKKARQEYENALSKGKTAVLAERDTKKNETMTIKLGNLRPL